MLKITQYSESPANFNFFLLRFTCTPFTNVNFFLGNRIKLKVKGLLQY